MLVGFVCEPQLSLLYVASAGPRKTQPEGLVERICKAGMGCIEITCSVCAVVCCRGLVLMSMYHGPIIPGSNF